MKVREIAIATAVAAVAAGAIFLLFIDRSDAPGQAETRTQPTATTTAGPEPTPLPATWGEGMRPAIGGEPLLISCLDGNRDDRLNGRDPGVPAGVDIALAAGKACANKGVHAEWLAGAPDEQGKYRCGGGAAPVRIVAVGGGGTDLLDPTKGESLGLIDIANDVRSRAKEGGIGTAVTLTASAVFDAASNAQQAMEIWLTANLRAEMAAMPCLRVVMVGHSHGGVTVTQVAAALDAQYGDRVLGVLLDRSIALYDRAVDDIPVRAPIFNFFQTNEGWHGVPRPEPNVTNFDESAQMAPLAPSEGGGGIAIVSHLTLDDSPAVQEAVVDALMGWLTAP